MSANSTIEWTDATWNPVTGCTKVSAGCDNCYAETFAERWRNVPGHYFEHGFDVQLRPNKLGDPLKWKAPRRIFVNSMSDLFHDDVPDEYIARAFAVMALARQHTFQLLTKRHGRMRALLRRAWFGHLVAEQGRQHHIGSQQDWLQVGAMLTGAPLPNVWLGVSVEDQKWADIRVPALLDTPAAVRFLSCEPLLGPVDLSFWMTGRHPTPDVMGLDWVITGGESGPRARPFDLDWARDIRDQCTTAGVAYFHKQHGGARPKANGRELDGRTWDQYPAVTS